MSVLSLSDRPKSVSIDRARIPKSYRDYLDILKSMGEMIEIDDEVDWHLELGAIFRHTAETLSSTNCIPWFRHQSSPSSRRSLTYLAMICGVMCGMSLPGPTFAFWTAARNRSVGAIDPSIGFSGFW